MEQPRMASRTRPEWAFYTAVPPSCPVSCCSIMPFPGDPVHYQRSIGNRQLSHHPHRNIQFILITRSLWYFLWEWGSELLPVMAFF